MTPMLPSLERGFACSMSNSSKQMRTPSPACTKVSTGSIVVLPSQQATNALALLGAEEPQQFVGRFDVDAVHADGHGLAGQAGGENHTVHLRGARFAAAALAADIPAF